MPRLEPVMTATRPVEIETGFPSLRRTTFVFIALFPVRPRFVRGHPRVFAAAECCQDGDAREHLARRAAPSRAFAAAETIVELPGRAPECTRG